VVLRLALWSLADSPATLEELRKLVRDEPTLRGLGVAFE
jgi:hypothetical protein